MGAVVLVVVTPARDPENIHRFSDTRGQMPSESDHAVCRRAVLGTLATAGIAGCQQIERLTDPEQFVRGSASWTLGSGEVPAETWPMARHDARQSGAALRNTGPEPPLERHWAVDAGEGGIYPPVVADGRVFAAKSYPNGLLLALDDVSGDEIWRYETEQLFTASPAVADGTVYVQEVLSINDRPEVVRAFDAATGVQQWEREVEQREGGDVLVDNGTVYVAADDRLVALDAASGTLAWWYRPGYPYRRVSSIAIGSERVYATAHTDNAGDSHTDRPIAGTVFALDPVEESTIWSVNLTQPSNVAVADDRVLVQDGNNLYSLETGDGEERWRAELSGHRRETSGTAPPKFSITEGAVHHQTTPAMEDTSGPAVATVSLDDGTERARYDLDHPTSSTTAPYLSVANDNLYAVTWAEESWIDVVDLESGERLTTASSDRVEQGLEQAGIPTVAGGSVFLPAEDRAVVSLR